jgi:hypothetical protein
VRNVRRSERILLVVPIRILSEAKDGQKPSEQGETLDISRHGATISLGRKLHAGQNITITRTGLLASQAVARVIGEIQGRSGNVYGVEFSDHAVDFWGITFPPPAESEKAVLRALLRCVTCRQLEVAYLDEFEAELFLAQHNLPRLCSRCGGWTTWAQPYGQTFEAAGEILQTSNPAQALDRVLARGERNRRTHGRIRLEAVACIRNPDVGEEVVLAADLARGGLSFFSSTNYTEGSQIEVAIPYSSRVPNIFAPARIVSSRRSSYEKFNQYGVTFVR